MMDDDYAATVRASRKRFRVVVSAILFTLVAALFAPWAAVRNGVLTSDLAEAFTVVAGLVVFAVWQALLMMVRDPAASVTFGNTRGLKRLGPMVLVGVSILATMLALAILSRLAGLISTEGLVWVALFAAFLGGRLAKTAFAVFESSAGPRAIGLSDGAKYR